MPVFMKLHAPQALRRHTGKNLPCPSSAMSSGRLFLDREENAMTTKKKKKKQVAYDVFTRGIKKQQEAAGLCILLPRYIRSPRTKRFLPNSNSILN